MNPVVKPSQSLEEYNQADYHRLMHTAAEKANLPGFGANGTIERCIEVVPAEVLYEDPHLKTIVTFTDEEVQRCAATIRARGQANAIYVIEVPNPQADFPEFAETLLIVDLDGMLIWRAAAEAKLSDVRIIRLDFTGNYYQQIIDAVARKSRQFSLRQLTLGRLAEHIIHLHTLEHPDAPALTIADVAPQIGYSASYLSRCVDVAEQPQPIIELMEANQLSFDQVRNRLLPIEDEAERIRIANALVTPPPNQKREPALRLVQSTMKWDAGDVAVDGHDLLLAHVDWSEATTASRALGVLLRDVNAVLTRLKIDNPAPFVRHLQTAIGSREGQDLILQAEQF